MVAWLSDHGTELGIAAAVGLGLILGLICLRMVAFRMLGGADATGWRLVAQRVVTRTHVLFIIITVLKLASLPLDLSERADSMIHVAFVIAAALQGAIWARAFVIGLIERKLGAEDNNGTLGTAIGLIRILVSVAVFLIAIIVILDNVGVNVTGLVAGLGIGGIAIGLAAQGIFKDLFAALSIVFDRPFRRGDSVAIGGVKGFSGTVEDIGLRTTRLRAVEGEMVSIGNDRLLQDRIHNYSLRARRRVALSIKVHAATARELLAQAPGELRKIVEATPHATFDRAHLVSIEPDAATLDLVFYIDSGDMVPFLDAKQAIILAMLNRFDEMGIEIAPGATEAAPAPSPAPPAASPAKKP